MSPLLESSPDASGFTAARLERLGDLLRVDSEAAAIPGAVAALMLMERGPLLLSDPVWRYLPALRQVQVGVEVGPPEGGQRRLALESTQLSMTLHDLLRHPSGIMYGQFGDSLVQRAYRSAHMIDDQQSNADMVAKLAAPFLFT